MIPVLLLAAVVTAEPGPLAIDRPAIDLGERPAAKPLVETVRLTNTGRAPLTIVDVSGPCGCFRHRVGTRELAPGDATDLTLSMNLLAQPEGAAVWKLGVKYKAGEAVHEQAIRLSATVKKDVTVEPAALMLSAEKEITGQIQVMDRRGKPLTVRATRIGLKHVTADVRPAIDRDGRRTQSIALSVADECPAGPYADELCIDTDDPEYREIRVPIRILKKGAATGAQASPSSLTLRFAKDQATASGLVRVRDAEGGRVTIEKVEADDLAISTKWAAGPGNMATVRVTVDRAKAAGAGVAVVTVTLSGPKVETILVPLSWTGP